MTEYRSQLGLSGRRLRELAVIFKYKPNVIQI